MNAALAASTTIPIVMLAIDFDPFARGYVASLSRPGGRITGIYLQTFELTLKRLQLFKEAIPELNSAIVLFDAVSRDQWPAAEEAGAKIGVRLSGIYLADPPFDYERALAEARPESPKNLFATQSSRLAADRGRLAEFALRHRFPSMFAGREFTDAGGLMSYGPNVIGMFGLAADFVDRIARGAKPGDLPIEQPTKFEFVINLTTANALGIEFSQTLLAHADEVIE